MVYTSYAVWVFCLGAPTWLQQLADQMEAAALQNSEALSPERHPWAPTSLRILVERLGLVGFGGCRGLLE